MQRITGILHQSLETAKKMRKLLFIVAAIYVVSFLAGYVMIYARLPFAVAFSEAVIKSILGRSVLSPIIEALKSGNLALAVASTFLVNLLLAAFATTTLPGLIPFVGGLGSAGMSALRGLVVGMTYYYAFGVSMGYTVVALGTAFLELGAYVFSATAGINISLSSVFPKRYQTQSGWVAFKESWKDAARIYVIVIVLLALGAIWETVGIYIAYVMT